MGHRKNQQRAGSVNDGPNRTVAVGTAVPFSGAASSDPDGTIANYAWVFGDIGSASGVSVSHTYTAAGTFIVTLTVTDDLGLTKTVVKSVTIGAPPAAK